MPIGIIAFVLFLAGLWQINKGTNKRITLLMRSGFGLILLYHLLAVLQTSILNDQSSELQVEIYRTIMAVLNTVGAALFAWGFYLLAKVYGDG